MTAYDVITQMGVTVSMVEEVIGIVDEMPHGYKMQKLDITSGKKKQAIKVFPNHPWTDGTVRPIYNGGWDACDYNVTIYLNTRI